jgi:hypothetical protein
MAWRDSDDDLGDLNLMLTLSMAEGRSRGPEDFARRKRITSKICCVAASLKIYLQSARIPSSENME